MQTKVTYKPFNETIEEATVQFDTSNITFKKVDEDFTLVAEDDTQEITYTFTEEEFTELLNLVRHVIAKS